MVDAAAGGSLNNKTPEQSWELFEVLASNNYQRPNEKTQKRGALEVDTTTALLALMQALFCSECSHLEVVGHAQYTSLASILRCDFCQGNHPNRECATEPTSDE